MGVHGIPDFVCCWDGQFIAIETKAPGRLGNVSTLQEYQIAQIKKSRGVAIVIDDVSQLAQLEKELTYA